MSVDFEIAKKDFEIAKKNNPDPMQKFMTGLLGGPRGDDSFEPATTGPTGYWDPEEKEWVVTEPCTMYKNIARKGKENEAEYWTIVFDKKLEDGTKTISYKMTKEGPLRARRLALRHQPRRGRQKKCRHGRQKK